MNAEPAGGRPLAGATCLVLGAGGFIGGHLCHALIGAGAAVHGFGRKPKFTDSLPKIRWTSGEFDDRPLLEAAVRGADIVFHLLGGTNLEISNRNPYEDLQVNAVSSLRLLELCQAEGVRKFVFVSSGGTVYGVPDRVPIPETARTDPISAYGINKLMVEKYLHLFRHLHGLNGISLRVANPYGPFQSPYRRQGVVAALIETFLKNRPLEIWGDGKIVRDFIFVEDLAEAILRAGLYEGPHQVMNIGSGEGRSLLSLVEEISAALDIPPPPIVHKPGRPADVPANVLDISRAREALGWQPRTAWRQGLRRTAEWIRQAYPEAPPPAP